MGKLLVSFSIISLILLISIFFPENEEKSLNTPTLYSLKNKNQGSHLIQYLDQKNNLSLEKKNKEYSIKSKGFQIKINNAEPLSSASIRMEIQDTKRQKKTIFNIPTMRIDPKKSTLNIITPQGKKLLLKNPYFLTNPNQTIVIILSSENQINSIYIEKKNENNKYFSSPNNSYLPRLPKF